MVYIHEACLRINGSQDIDQKMAFYVFNTGSKYRLIFI